MSNWNKHNDDDGYCDFAALYTAKSATPRHCGDYSTQLQFTPSPKKLDGLDLNQNFCSKDNLDQCLSYLNETLTVLGFSSIFHDVSDTFDITRLVNVTHDLLQRHQNSRRSFEDLENRLRKTEADRNHLQKTQSRLKESLEQSERAYSQLEEKERQLLNKIKAVGMKLRSEKEECPFGRMIDDDITPLSLQNKRLQSVIQHRTMQFQHELKKKERETCKLKERLHKLLTDKSQDRRMGLDILNTLQRSDGRRGTWRTNGSTKHEEEMYRLLISSYEEKQKVIMIENSDLRQSLAEMQRELIELLNSTTDTNDVSLCSEENLSSSPSTPPTDYNDLSEGHFQMPYMMVRDPIHRSFNEKKKLLKERMRKSNCVNHDTQSTSSTPSNGPVCNRTFSKTPSPTDSKGEVDKLMKKISYYKGIVKQQQQLIQQSFHQSPGNSPRFLDDDLLEDQETLARERQLVHDQKVHVEEERRYIKDAARKLNRERKAFEEEKASILSKQFMQMTPFVRRESGRLTTVIPSFSAAPSNSDTKVCTPATGELYRTLGLHYKDEQDSTHSTSQQSLNSSHESSGKHPPSNGPSPVNRSRINEHMQNIKTALFKKTGSPNVGEDNSISSDE